MKIKNLLITLSCLLMITGCGGNNIELDLEKVEIELNSLEIEKDGEKTKLFEHNKKLDEDAIEGRQIDTSLFEELLFSMDSTTNVANIYIVYLPKAGNEEECEQQIDDYLAKIEDNMELYNSKEAKKISERLEEKYGNYYIYLISDNNEVALEKIKNTK